MELILLNDGLYSLVEVTKEMTAGITLLQEADCFDLCDILRLHLTTYYDYPINAHVMKDGTLMKGETHSEGAALTKKSGKNKEGGLNEKGRKSYEKENPGSDLKAPTKKKGNKRRASFCARMKGMKKKLTSKKTASDPDSRINKSLRKWDC